MRRTSLMLLVGMVATAAGCKKEAHAPPAATEVVVARVGERKLTLKEVEALLQAQPDFVRVSYATAERKKEFVDSLVRTELLVQEARRRGLEKDPEVVSLMEKVLVQRLLQAQLVAKPVTAEEVKAAYDAHRAEYVRPERVRVALVLFAGADARQVRSDAQKETARLFTLKEAARPAAFSALVKAKSTHEATRNSDGDTGPRTMEELTQQFGERVADAAFALKQLGELSQVVEADQGFVLLRLVGRQPGAEQSLESVRPRIEAQLQAERRAKELDELVTGLRKSTPVQLFPDAVERLNAAAPQGPLLNGLGGGAPPASAR